MSDHDPVVAYFNLPRNQDIDTQVTVTRSGLIYGRATGLYSGTIRVRNVSGRAIAGPVQVVLAGLPATVTLKNAAGYSVQGPNVTALAGGSLARRRSARVLVQFSVASGSSVHSQSLCGGSLTFSPFA